MCAKSGDSHIIAGNGYSPVRRWLQKAAVIYYISQIFISCLITYWLYNTRFYFLVYAYFAWIYYDRNTSRRGSRPLRWMRKWVVYKYIRDYFPIKLHKTVDLDANENYIFASHPHGIISISNVINFGTDTTGFHKLFPGIRIQGITLNINFWVPFYREVILSFGFISADKESIDYILTRKRKGNAVFIVVGGANESLDAVPNTMQLTLKNRKGFVRMALLHGASLVPCITFGENEIYSMPLCDDDSLIKTIQKRLMRTFVFAFPLFYGTGIIQNFFGWVPYRHEINTIVGKPIKVKKNENPTEEEINNLHNLYIESLCDLFHEHKKAYSDCPDIDIIIK